MAQNQKRLFFSCFVLFLISVKAKSVEETGDASQKGQLINHPACKRDLLALTPRCGLKEADMENDLAVLSCAQDRPPDEFQAVSDTCEQVLWRYKFNLTKSDVFVEQIRKICSRDQERLAPCEHNYPVQEAAGHYMSCVIDAKLEGGLKPECQDFLTQVESVIFSDYRLIGDFAEKCHADIESYICGNVRRKAHSDSQVIYYHHSQGTVLECLSKHVDKVNATCKHEILRVAELQSDDYHLDRTLYFACKSDREKFCAQTRSGQGRVYECLMKNKEDTLMSGECKSQLRRRQKLVAENYKISHGLAKACRNEIHDFKCRRNTKPEKTVRLAQILLCLEDVMRNEEGVISGQCQAEMVEHRKMLMEDYAVSPEIVAKCADDINNSCGGGKKKDGAKVPNSPGKTIHCLMKLASEQKLQNPVCENELRLLLREADVASDWKADPVLKKACQDVVMAACNPNSGPTGVLSCLMTQAATNSRHMTQECKASLLEIQYFLARDFTLDPKLYKKCHKDARRICNAEDDWHKKAGQDTAGAEARLVFPCLVRHLYGVEEEQAEEDVGELSDHCADEVERVLEQRALSVNLHPEIEDSCRGELTQKCGHATGNGQELQCLQDNMDSLGSECLNAVKTYTEIEAKNAVLNPVIAGACHQIIDNHCAEEVSHKDEGVVIQCLIQFRDAHANDGVMDEKCSAAVEHWQILSLKDWKFSFKFKDACKSDIRKLCLHPKSKADVVGCLSKIARDDILTDTRPKSISPPCRAQLRFQVLQKHSDIKLNIKVAKACTNAIQSDCPVGHGNVLECLKQLDHTKLNGECRAALFVEEQEEVVLSSVDHALMTGCKHEIKQHCGNHDELNGVLNCLKEIKDDPNFDRTCKLIVNRRIIQHTKDYRMRPRLQKACEMDMKKFCANVLLQGDVESTKDFLEGSVVQCLQDKFVQSPDYLSAACKREIDSTLRDAALDYRANPQLIQHCPLSIASCQSTLDDTLDKSLTEYGGKVEECLRTKFKSGDLNDGKPCSRTVAKLIEATNVDIHADPLLYRACVVDITKFCRDVPEGNGQQLKCLANVVKDAQLKLEPKCEDLLKSRMEMFDMALKVVPIDGIQDLLTQVSLSPHKNYFILLVLMFFSLIFIVGLLCGRVTKRVRRELKDR